MSLFSGILLSLPVFSAEETVDKQIHRLEMEIMTMNHQMVNPTSTQDQQLLQEQLNQKLHDLDEFKRAEFKQKEEKIASDIESKHEKLQEQAASLSQDISEPKLTDLEKDSIETTIEFLKAGRESEGLEAWKKWLKKNERPDPKQEHDLYRLATWVAQKVAKAPAERICLKNLLFKTGRE